jgi:stage III sporulation protein SpoIIIAA
LDAEISQAVAFEEGAKAAEAAGLRIDVLAPHPKAPSMSMAIQQFITGK